MTWKAMKSAINNPITKNTVKSSECINDKLINEAFGK